MKEKTKHRLIQAISFSMTTYIAFKTGQLYGTFETAREVLNSAIRDPSLREVSPYIYDSAIRLDSNQDKYVSRLEIISDFLKTE